MGYITVSRRVVKVKIKKRTAQHNFRTVPQQSSGVDKATLPPLFDRNPAISLQRALPAPWWTQWKWLSLAGLTALTLGFLIYLAASSGQKERVRRPATTTATVTTQVPRVNEVINIRPMGYSSQRGTNTVRSAPEPSFAVASISGAASPERSFSGIPKGPGRNSKGQDEIYEGKLDTRHPLALPDDISGNCNLRSGSVRELGDCLSTNGARPR